MATEFEIVQQGEDIQAVKIGFSWPALFFSWIWAFVFKIWGWGAAVLALTIAVNVIGELAARGPGALGLGVVLAIAWIGVIVWFAAKANAIKKRHFINRGYRQQPGVFNAASKAAAVDAFRERAGADPSR